MTTLVDRLEDWETVHQDDLDKPDGHLYLEAADMIRRLMRIVEHTYPEQTGSFFICGASPIGDDGLPDSVSICPAYGADWSATYKRI